MSDKLHLEDPQRVLHISQSLSLFAETPTLWSSARDVSRFVSRINPASEFQATQAVLLYQLGREICPVISYALSLSPYWDANLKAAVSLLYRCNTLALAGDVILASLAMDPLSYHEADEALGTSDIDVLTAEIMNPTRTWISGLGETVTHPRAIVEELIPKFFEYFPPCTLKNGNMIFRQRSTFESSDEFESTLKGFGRLLGLAIKHRVEFAHRLRIPQPLYEAIHHGVPIPSLLDSIHASPIETRSVFATQELVDRTVREPILFIRFGIRDVLGPAGIFAISRSRWNSLYRSD